MRRRLNETHFTSVRLETFQDNKEHLLEQLRENKKSKKCLDDEKRAKYDFWRKISIGYIYCRLYPKCLLLRPSQTHGTFLMGIPLPLPDALFKRISSFQLRNKLWSEKLRYLSNKKSYFRKSVKLPDRHVVHESSNRKFISRHVKISGCLFLFSTICAFTMFYKRYGTVEEKTVIVERINHLGKSLECRKKLSEFTLGQEKDYWFYQDEMQKFFIFPEDLDFSKIVTRYGFVNTRKGIS
ncbi:hypothetical protein RF11_06692 [Thelohanellus kitauei]|uniref:Uncharacterized protein n=1 Tax=Thelohanellus kitauei TaxID=669202 RepID=A0A0C2ILH6_THEKT|nr:hypothetical protein RF11_06692 [Thelohanellus kitauei]